MFGIADNVVVGYDLSNEYSQISYWNSADEIPKTVSLVKNGEEFNIPACLFKRSEVNQWFVGREALEYMEYEDGELVERLWERALLGEEVEIVGEKFDPISLLSLYVRRSLSLLLNEVKKPAIKGIMFTVPNLTKRAIDVLEMIVASLDFGDIKVAFQGRDESIFYYTIHQPTELWQYDTFVYDYSDGRMTSYRFYINKKTRPEVGFVETVTHSEISSELSGEQLDQAFIDVVKKTTDGHIVTCAYLIGEGFEGEWCKDSLRELCRNRRAFRGNNLYSRGACYAMRARLEAKGNLGDAGVVFLGKDKLRDNVGINVIRKREESYLPLLNGGENWFDSRESCDLILEDEGCIRLTITPLDGRNVREVEIVLEGISEREPKATRVRLETLMESQNVLRVNITDMGFGEFYPATNQMFTRQIVLDASEEE